MGAGECAPPPKLIWFSPLKRLHPRMKQLFFYIYESKTINQNANTPIQRILPPSLPRKSPKSVLGELV